ncbi:MAG: tRNA threonylcarbamoyladenosine dehydratase [Clostridia bacterium]|nr:tRNA threonylcarbamoyladenosine dehydratase [Clostridia bacterium]
MNDFQMRSAALFSQRVIDAFADCHVAVFGLGGVGGHAAEALCRGGIGKITLVDGECYELSNCNRQLFATTKTLGRPKVEAASERLKEINPSLEIRSHSLFFQEGCDTDALLEGVDYILDAIDTVSSKLFLIQEAFRRRIPVISSMGTGNKLDPTAFRVTDLYSTKVCPLARVMRYECKKRGIPGFKVVYSEEEPISSHLGEVKGKHIPGSVSFVPGVAGMILAGEILKDLSKICLSSEQKN